MRFLQPSQTTIDFDLVGDCAPTRTLWFVSTAHEALGVPPDADSDAIARAFRRLALEHHPDRNPGNATSAEAFRRAAAAYEDIQKDHQLAVHPARGSWWIVRSVLPRQDARTIGGIVFEALDRPQAPEAAETVIVRADGEDHEIVLCWGRRPGPWAWLANSQFLRERLEDIEAAVLLAICLVVAPALAAAIGVVVWLLTGSVAIAVWTAVLVAAALFILGVAFYRSDGEP